MASMMKCTRGFVLMVIAGVALTTWSAPCLADRTQTRSIEDSLLDDARPGPSSPADRKDADTQGLRRPSQFAPARVTRQSFWADELGMASVSEDVLPLLSVVQQMRDVENMLTRAECGTATQHAQRQILDSIDRLLEQAGPCCGSMRPCSGKSPAGAQQPSSCKGSGSAKSGMKQGTTPDSSGKAAPGASQQPAGDSRHVDPAEMREVLKRLWGELPPREREQMLQLPVEEFLPRYEIMIEDYFRRLSEQKQKQE